VSACKRCGGAGSRWNNAAEQMTACGACSPSNTTSALLGASPKEDMDDTTQDLHISGRITAGELRAMGYAIPDNIPDCGNIPRHSMQMRATGGDVSGDTLTMNLEVTFTEPFTWFEATVTVDKTP
jgi:hypothetical protein